jgi:signal transduction histidine kinase
MIEAIKAPIRRHWPRLRLRTILLLTFVFVAALPGVGALFLRVYENTLVRQTEAELIAQGAALAAVASADWPGSHGPDVPPAARPQSHPDGLAGGALSTIDLRTTPILPERPGAVSRVGSPTPDAVAAGTRLEPLLAATAQTTLASIQLLDPAGRILTGADAGKAYPALPELAVSRAGRPDTVLRRRSDYYPHYRFEWLSRASDLRIHHARPVIVDGRVVAVLLLSRSPRALFRGLYEDRGKILLGIVLIFGVLVVLSGLLSRGIARPIEALSEATRHVALGRGQMPVPPPTAAIEIQALYVDFARMAEAIGQRSRYLRDFAHAVSHEFKTPLAGIRGAIELLDDHHATMSEEERRRFLANAAADAERLAQLVTRLLDLARADMAESGGAIPTDLRPAFHRLADANHGEAFHVVLALPPPGLIVAVPAATIETVIGILIENSRQAGATAVTLAAHAAQDHVTVTLADDGPGIPPGDRDRIFEPFFTSRRASGGTGLGLAIARSLLSAAGATIALAGGGPDATFLLRLPRPAPNLR